MSRPPSASGPAAGMSNEDIVRLIAENNALKNKVQNQEVRISALKQVAAEFAPGMNLEIKKRRSSVVMRDGRELSISATPEELAIMKHVFDSFDAEKKGHITVEQITALHMKLGEPLTEAEAKEAFATMDEEGTGQVRFPQFMKWWQADHKYDATDKKEKQARYRSKFKFLKAKVKGLDIAKMSTFEEGVRSTLEWRVRFMCEPEEAGSEPIPVSPWHDVELFNSDGTYNYVVEIPKWTRAKYEIATGEPYNPIKQDVKNGVLREYKWGDMMFNYGAFPRTWEDPHHISEDTGKRGDNDPLDVIEIGVKQYPCGAIVKVKVLGVLAMIDSGETDWKTICISADDPMCDLLNDVADVDTHIPGCIKAIREWLRSYKIADGKEPNTFGLNEVCMNKDYAVGVLKETHEFWKKLQEVGTTVPSSGH